MSDLARRTCLPCRGGVPPLTREQVAPLLQQLGSGWVVDERSGPANPVLFLKRTYRLKNFAEAIAAASAIGVMAEEQQHHPDLHVSWGSLGVEIWTHKIGGLTESDFILAAKCDVVLEGGAVSE
ncbi:MAG: 4a-hydroxytetrahydrobiopterin dehydratase [Candidatus Tumulicola sp.]